MLPEQEDNSSNHSTTEQPDDLGRVPRIVTGSELKRQEEHDRSWGEKNKPKEIKLRDQLAKHLGRHFWLDSLIGNPCEDEEYCDKATEREVDVKACYRVRCGCTLRLRTTLTPPPRSMLSECASQ